WACADAAPLVRSEGVTVAPPSSTLYRLQPPGPPVPFAETPGVAHDLALSGTVPSWVAVGQIVFHRTPEGVYSVATDTTINSLAVAANGRTIMVGPAGRIISSPPP